jgi:signal peptidase
MEYRRIALFTGELTLLVLVLGIITGQVLGQPVLIGFVKTGSMAPTLHPGDGFVAVPTELSGKINENDVVVFQAKRVDGGGLTTHRVIEKTDRGFVTKGDANPFTDQEGANEPPVQRETVVATAWRPLGSVLVIPHLGTAVTVVQTTVETLQRQVAVTFGTSALLGSNGLLLLFSVGFSLVFLFDVVRSSAREETREDKRKTGRDTGTSVRFLIAGFVLLIVLVTTAAMVLPSGVDEYSVVSATFDGERPTVIERGSSSTVNYTVTNSGVLPIHVYLDPASDGIAVNRRHVSLPPRSQRQVSVTLSAPESGGVRRQYLTKHRYLALLPEPAIRGLYNLHPWVPILVIALVVGGVFTALSVVLLGTGDSRVRDRTRS